MATCSFYNYKGGYCCDVKDKIQGQKNNKVDQRIYKDFCSKSNRAYEKCVYYLEYIKQK